VNVPFNVQNILQKEWRQGSLCSDVACDALHIASKALAIVLSHDCDVVQPNIEKEPYIEILIASPIPQLDGNCTRGKNSRCYHFQINNLSYEIKAIERISVPRQILADYEPHYLTLPTEEIKAIVHWFAQRYERPAFPNNFNKRLSKKTKQIIVQILREFGHLVSGFYIACPNEELPDDMLYDILLYVVMSDEDFENAEKFIVCEKISKQIFEAVRKQSNGITITNSENLCISEKEISLHDLRYLKRFTSFDHFSFVTGIEPKIS
jgi:hypothetical protein